MLISHGLSPIRNDALYKATTTTSTTTTTQAPPPTTTTLAPERPLRRPGARRPLRRRPQHEYYYDDDDYEDDYVEERMNRRRKPNRNRNRRPEYDEYDSPPRASYKDDDADYSYEQRPLHRERNRNRDSEDDVDYDYDRRGYERPRNRKRPAEPKRHYDDDIDDRRPYSDGRKHLSDGEKRKHGDRRPPVSDDRKGYADDKLPYDDRRSLGEEDRSPVDDKRNSHDDRRKVNDERRPLSEDRRGLNEERRNHHEKRRPIADRRPQYDDDYEELPKKSSNNRDEDFDEKPAKRPVHDAKPEIIPKVRSSSATSSIYNRPRAPPKINRPVPNNEKKKYEYAPQKPEKSTTGASLADEEFYDDEYDYDVEPAKPQPEIKQEPIESKKPAPPAPPSQREHRPLLRGEIKTEKQQPFNADVLEDEEFDFKTKVTSSKPQRSTSPRVEPIQQMQQRPAKPEFIEMRPKDIPIKQNSKAPIEFNQDEYIPDAETDYTDEETDDRETNAEDAQKSTRNDYRSSMRAPEPQSKVPTGMLANQKLPVVLDEREKSEFVPAERPANVDQFKTKFHRLGPPSNVRTANDNYQKPNTEPEERDVYTILSKETVSTIREPSGFKPVGFNHEPVHELEIEPLKSRPYVRIMKRPFLPSRGGSPYLPRGLKPVGTGITNAEFTTENTRISPNSSPLPGVQLFDHSLPIIRPNFNNAYAQPQNHGSPHMHTQSQHQSHLPAQSPQSPQTIPTDIRTTTQPPQIESPRSPLDEIFNSDYDVTLNDALNPTLKPLSQSHESPIGFSLNKYDRANPYARSDVTHSSSQYRSTAIQAPLHVQSRQNAPAQQISQSPQQQTQPQQQQSRQSQQQQQQYYDDDYEY